MDLPMHLGRPPRRRCVEYSHCERPTRRASHPRPPRRDLRQLRALHFHSRPSSRPGPAQHRTRHPRALRLSLRPIRRGACRCGALIRSSPALPIRHGSSSGSDLPAYPAGDVAPACASSGSCSGTDRVHGVRQERASDNAHPADVPDAPGSRPDPRALHDDGHEPAQRAQLPGCGAEGESIARIL